MDTPSLPVTEPYRILVVVLALFTTLASTFALCVRFYARHANKGKLGIDDWLCLISVVLAWGVYITTLVSITHGGLGIHMSDLMARLGPTQTIQVAEVLMKTMLAHGELWSLSGFTVQLAILTLYVRLFGLVKWFRITCYVVMGLVVIWLIATVASTLTQCLPLEKLWLQLENPNYPGRCAAEKLVCNSTGISHAVLDGVILFLPFPMIWNLYTSTSNKILFSVIFTLGSTATVFGALRMACLISLIKVDPTDFTGTQWLQLLFMILEIDLGIICACLPSFPVVLQMASRSRLGSYARQLFSLRSLGSGRHKGGSSSGSGSGSDTRGNRRPSDGTVRNDSYTEIRKGSSRDIHVTKDVHVQAYQITPSNGISEGIRLDSMEDTRHV